MSNSSKTVLILGAGASVPFGLPTGATLMDDPLPACSAPRAWCAAPLLMASAWSDSWPSPALPEDHCRTLGERLGCGPPILDRCIPRALAQLATHWQAGHCRGHRSVRTQRPGRHTLGSEWRLATGSLLPHLGAASRLATRARLDCLVQLRPHLGGVAVACLTGRLQHVSRGS